MEHVIGELLQDFETGKLTRRQLIQTPALGVTAGPAALRPRRSQKIQHPATALSSAVEDCMVRSRLVRCLRLPAKHRVLSRPDGMGDHSRRRPEAVLNENRQCWRHHYPKSRRIRGHRGRPDSADYHRCDRPHLLGYRAVGECQSEGRTRKTRPGPKARYERQIPEFSRPRS